MPRQNRVTPDGTLIAVPDRALFWGNRGALHDRAGRLVRYSRGRAWAICVLEFKGRRRQLWAPGRLTELFFLDEATGLAAGLAAGHRPCGECRYRDYQAFKRAWAVAFGGVVPGVAEKGPGVCDMHRGGLRVPHCPGSLPCPEASIRIWEREFHDREDFYTI